MVLHGFFARCPLQRQSVVGISVHVVVGRCGLLSLTEDVGRVNLHTVEVDGTLFGFSLPRLEAEHDFLSVLLHVDHGLQHQSVFPRQHPAGT